MRIDAQKDPSIFPEASLAKLLLDQVSFFLFLIIFFLKEISCMLAFLISYFFTFLSFYPGSFQVDRKLVKQTVMTFVYGVTYVGARDQIRKKLNERDLKINETLMFSLSSYAAKVKFHS